jgi:2-methylcitrate dehydratase
MVAVPLIFGRLTARDYEDDIAADTRIDALREKINCIEDTSYTADYHDPAKRSIANAITIEFTDGTILGEEAVEYPIGHARRRSEGIPLLIEKFKINLARNYDKAQQEKILAISLDYEKLAKTPVNEYMDLLAKK